MAEHTSSETPGKGRRDDLVALVQERIERRPYEHRGRVWAALEQSVYADILAVDVKTIGRWTSKPPFVKAIVQLEHGGRITLLRLGDADPDKPEETIARVMCSDLNREFKACRKRDEQALAEMAPDDPKAIRLAKLLRRAQRRSTQDDWGCMCELARQWSPKIAAEAFRYAITHWSETALSIKVEASSRGDELTDQRFYRYPTTRLMRKYPEAALAPWLVNHQFQKTENATSKLNF